VNEVKHLGSLEHSLAEDEILRWRSE
jgi:hypothetical protein